MPSLPPDKAAFASSSTTLQGSNLDASTNTSNARSMQFWSDVLSVWQKNAENDWLSEQRAVWTVVRSGLHHVRVLNGAVYNYPPRMKDDPCTGVVVAHYKGNRKSWMR